LDQKNKVRVGRAALQASERNDRNAARTAKRATDAAKTNAPPPYKTVARANARAPGAAESAISPLPSPGEAAEEPATEAVQTTLLPSLGVEAAGPTSGEVEAIFLPLPTAAMRVLVPEAAGGGDVDEGRRGELKAKLTGRMGELICRLFPTDGEGVPLKVLKAMSEWAVAEIAKTRMPLKTLAAAPAPEPATALLQPAEATRELSDLGPAVTLLGILGPATT
jgi:hypothetical protein